MHWCVSSPFIRWIDRDMSLQRTKYLIDEYSDDIEDEDDLPLFEEEDTIMTTTMKMKMKKSGMTIIIGKTTNSKE